MVFVQIKFLFLFSAFVLTQVIDKLPIPSLSVAIKMPQITVENLMSEPKRIRGLPLCYYGCPRAAANRQRSADSGSVGRSNSGGSYYKSNCPAFPPPTVESEHSSPSPLTASAEEPQSDSGQPQDFSSSLSAEFLHEDEDEDEDDMSPESSSIPLASDVIAGTTRRRHRASSHESNGGGGTSAVICASLNSVHRVLADSTVVGYRLRLPGEDNFSSSPSSSPNDDSYMSSDSTLLLTAHVMNSALTSQSSPISRYHSVFVYLVVILILVCR